MRHNNDGRADADRELRWLDMTFSTVFSKGWREAGQLGAGGFSRTKDLSHIFIDCLLY